MTKPLPVEEPTFIEERWYVRNISKQIAAHTNENETQLIAKNLVKHRAVADVSDDGKAYIAEIIGEAVSVGVVLSEGEDWQKLV